MSGPRIALVGYGSIASHHIAVLRHVGAQIVASCNRSVGQRQRAVEEAGIPATYCDPAEMMDRERPDGVVVCASVMSLYELGCKIIPFGVPVLLEKPPGTSLEQTTALATLAGQHGTPVMVGLNRRFYSVFHKALAEVGGREAVTSVSVEWSEDPGRMLQLGHPPEMMPLMSFANSLHGIDLLTFFAGSIPCPKVWGRDLDRKGTDFRWQMSLDGVAASGARVRFESSWDVPGRWRLVVDTPGVRMVSAPLESCQLLRCGKPPQEISPSTEDSHFKPGFFGQAACFLGTIKSCAPATWPACTLDEVVQSARLAQLLTLACGAREI